MAGSATKTSSVDFQNTGDPAQDVVMAIYAPQLDDQLPEQRPDQGRAGGKVDPAPNSVTLTYDDRVKGIVSLNSAQLFQLGSGFQECTGTATATAPDSGC